MALETFATIRDIITRTAQVTSFRIVPEAYADFAAGQWLFVKIQAPGGELSKPLSISSAPDEKSYLEFTKKITTNEFSRALVGLRVGDRITIKYPFGNFIFPNDTPKIAFLSGGIGITPVWSICQDITSRGLKTDVVLLYGNNSIEEIAFKDGLDRLKSRNPKLKIVHVLQCASEGWQGRTGFITDAIIKEEIPDYLERRFYLCGPPPMVEVLKTVLVEKCRLPKGQLVLESFAGYA